MTKHKGEGRTPTHRPVTGAAGPDPAGKLASRGKRGRACQLLTALPEARRGGEEGSVRCPHRPLLAQYFLLCTRFFPPMTPQMLAHAGSSVLYPGTECFPCGLLPPGGNRGVPAERAKINM